MTKTRNRKTIALSEEGVELVKTTVSLKGWTQDEWAAKAYISTSTIKRLIKGTPVDPSSLELLLKALDLEIQDSYTVKESKKAQTLSLTNICEQTEHIRLPQQSVDNSSSQHQSGVFMTATFTEDKRPQIERVMRHLRTLLIDGEITYSKDTGTGTVTITGDFSEEDRKHINMTITQLEKFFTSCRITW